MVNEVRSEEAYFLFEISQKQYAPYMVQLDEI